MVAWGSSGRAVPIPENYLDEWITRAARPIGAHLAAGTVLLGMAAPWAVRQPVALTGTAIASAVAPGVLSTGMAYVLNHRLIGDEGPTAASMASYPTPVVAVLPGVAVVDERLSWNLVVGTAMVLLGVWTAERNRGGRRSAASDASALPEEDVAQPRNTFGSVLWQEATGAVSCEPVVRRLLLGLDPTP
jgi:hypothetical protein